MERIVLDFTSSHKFNKHYQFGIGSGHATLALRKDYLEESKEEKIICTYLIKLR